MEVVRDRAAGLMEVETHRVSRDEALGEPDDVRARRAGLRDPRPDRRP